MWNFEHFCTAFSIGKCGENILFWIHCTVKKVFAKRYIFSEMVFLFRNAMKNFLKKFSSKYCQTDAAISLRNLDSGCNLLIGNPTTISNDVTGSETAEPLCCALELVSWSRRKVTISFHVNAHFHTFKFSQNVYLANSAAYCHPAGIFLPHEETQLLEKKRSLLYSASAHFRQFEIADDARSKPWYVHGRIVQRTWGNSNFYHTLKKNHQSSIILKKKSSR